MSRTPTKQALHLARQRHRTARTFASSLRAAIDVSLLERQVIRERKAAEWREFAQVADEHPIRETDLYDAPAIMAGARNYTERND